MPVATLALELLIAAVQNAQSISQLISNAKANNRDVTWAELQSIIEGDAVARAQLIVTIANAKAAGR